jgi:hypothetical protein
MQRVDKQWKEKGLTGYSTEAIAGTLAHYGVIVDVASLPDSLAKMTPLQLAGQWKSAWKGTGQFATFPYAAAEAFARRFHPEKPTPMQNAEKLAVCCTLGNRALGGMVPAELAQAFADATQGLATLPPASEARDFYVTELVSILEPVGEPFNALPRQLAQAGLKEQAMQFASLHERLFLERAGCVTALVRGLTGEREVAAGELKKIAEAGPDVFARYGAVDCLAQLEAIDELKATSLGVFDAAAAEEKWSLCDALAHLLADVVRSGTAGNDEAFIREVGQRFAKAHEHAHH